MKDEDNKDLKQRFAEKYSWESQKINESLIAAEWTEIDRINVETRHEREACRGWGETTQDVYMIQQREQERKQENLRSKSYITEEKKEEKDEKRG